MSWRKSRAQTREQRAKEALTCLKHAGHNPKSGLLLDLGCGRGYLTGYFLKQKIDAIGVDISKKAIKDARRRIPDGIFICADGTKLPFREGCFHTIILNDVLEHIPYNYGYSILSEMKRVLKDSGRIYISVANRYQIREPHTRIPFLTWLPKRWWDTFCYRLTKGTRLKYGCYPYTVRDLRKLTEKVGLACIDYTWLYAWNKLSNVELIGDPLLRSVVKVIKKFGLFKLAHVIAVKLSVILFICQKK